MKKRLLPSFIDVSPNTQKGRMKSMRILMLLAFFSLWGDAALAQSNYFCLYSKDQTHNRAWEVSQVRKLTFSESKVSVYSPLGTELYAIPYDNVRKFTFQDEPPTGLAQPEEQPFSLKYDASQRALLVSGTDVGVLQLYSVNGTLAWSAQISDSRSAYPIADLPAGIYIARLSSGASYQSIKIIIK